MNIPRRRNHAFTLIEALIVVGLIVIIICIAVPKLLSLRDDATCDRITANRDALNRVALRVRLDVKTIPPEYCSDSNMVALLVAWYKTEGYLKDTSIDLTGLYTDDCGLTWKGDCSGATHANNPEASGTVTVSASDASATAPVGSTGAVVFTLSLSAASNQNVSVDYHTADGTAVSGIDFTPANGTALFRPGDLTKTVAVQITPQSSAAKTFTLALFNAANATPGRNGSGTVSGTGATGVPPVDPGVTLAVSDGVNESLATKLYAVFTVRLSTSTSVPISVHYKTADGTAVAGVDYVSTEGAVSFAPDESSSEVLVGLVSDPTRAIPKTFTFNLTAPNPSVTTVATPSGQGVCAPEAANLGTDTGTGSGSVLDLLPGAGPDAGIYPLTGTNGAGFSGTSNVVSPDQTSDAMVLPSWNGWPGYPSVTGGAGSAPPVSSSGSESRYRKVSWASLPYLTSTGSTSAFSYSKLDVDFGAYNYAGITDVALVVDQWVSAPDGSQVHTVFEVSYGMHGVFTISGEASPAGYSPSVGDSNVVEGAGACSFCSYSIENQSRQGGCTIVGIHVYR